MITENVSNFKIHKLTQEQYDRELAAGTLDQNAIYLTPNDDSQSDEINLGIQAEITSLAGAIVYCTDSNGNSFTGVVGVDGKLTMAIPDYGTYTFYAELDGSQSNVISVNLNETKLYRLSLLFYKYYGVKIAISTSSPESAVTYIDDAEGMTAGWSNWKDTPIFANIKPCVLLNGEVQYYLNPDNYSKKEDGTTATINSTTAGDVMVEIPKLGYKMTTDGTYHYIWVTDDPDAEGYCYAAHSKNELGDCDKIYIGAYFSYLSSSKLYSISGQSPTTGTSVGLTNARTYAANRGDGYESFSFYPLTLLQCMFLLIYKNRNSQSALGQGYVGGSAKQNTGATNSSGFMYGSTSTTSRVKFLGIEDFWGNLSCWVDGFYCDSSFNVLTYYKDMTGADDGTDYQFSCSSGISSNSYGWMRNIIGTNHGGFVGKTFSGSATTYYSDDSYLYSDGYASFGGYYNASTYAGAFMFQATLSNSGSNLIGHRLVYKHIA